MAVLAAVVGLQRETTVSPHLALGTETVWRLQLREWSKGYCSKCWLSRIDFVLAYNPSERRSEPKCRIASNAGIGVTRR